MWVCRTGSATFVLYVQCHEKKVLSFSRLPFEAMHNRRISPALLTEICGGDGDDARDGAGVGDACAGVRVQRQQSPTVFASPKRGLYLMKYRCPNNNSNIVAKRLLFNPAGEGPARTRAVQG